MLDEPLRIALLTYRGHPHVGGQGVYVSYLALALQRLGHEVTVFSGQPYPELGEGIRFEALAGLDLYRPDDPFRRPARSEFRDPIDVLEYGLMCTAAFPEPLSFSLRAARALKSRTSEFDVVHDNQCLGYGLLLIQRRGLPVVATVHHPITIDRRVDLAGADDKKRAALRRWYSFVRMQRRVARRLPRVITVSERARADVVREFRLEAEHVSVVHNGVDPQLFRPLQAIAKVPGRVVTMASSEAPMKGLEVLIEALAKVRTERAASLTVVGKGCGARARALARRYGVEHAVTFAGQVDALALVELLNQAEVAVVPSLYEGFSLPAVEAMACGLPLVVTTGGALPEVAGRHDDTALLVPPGDAGALAAAVGMLLDDGRVRVRIGNAGRRRALNLFTWEVAGKATIDCYREALARC